MLFCLSLQYHDLISVCIYNAKLSIMFIRNAFGRDAHLASFLMCVFLEHSYSLPLNINLQFKNPIIMQHGAFRETTTTVYIQKPIMNPSTQ